jgi:DNA-directed RNA polymerase specialized sigma24 family protein
MTSVSQLGRNTIDRLRSRDPEALSEVLHAHARPLYRAARGMGFRENEAEDLVQGVFTTFLETLDRFQGLSQVNTWLLGIRGAGWSKTS